METINTNEVKEILGLSRQRLLSMSEDGRLIKCGDGLYDADSVRQEKFQRLVEKYGFKSIQPLRWLTNYEEKEDVINRFVHTGKVLYYNFSRELLLPIYVDSQYLSDWIEMSFDVLRMAHMECKDTFNTSLLDSHIDVIVDVVKKRAGDNSKKFVFMMYKYRGRYGIYKFFRDITPIYTENMEVMKEFYNMLPFIRKEIVMMMNAALMMHSKIIKEFPDNIDPENPFISRQSPFIRINHLRDTLLAVIYDIPVNEVKR